MNPVLFGVCGVLFGLAASAWAGVTHFPAPADWLSANKRYKRRPDEQIRRPTEEDR
jgi:hypothetical protein